MEPQHTQSDEADDYVLVDTTPRTKGFIPAIFHLPNLNGYDLFEITVDELQRLYSAKAFSSEEYTQFCLDRVQAVNPYLEAVIETNPDALQIARSLDEERRKGRLRGPLHGVPVFVKDVGE